MFKKTSRYSAVVKCLGKAGEITVYKIDKQQGYIVQQREIHLLFVITLNGV